jgi:glycosyltransferase involved in cell wall biosynthesis
MQYVIIIPAKNEELNLPLVLNSLVKQTLPPRMAVVVDDHSTDNTPAITQAYRNKHPFIQYLKKEGKQNTYQLGGKVVGVFHYGLEHIKHQGIDFDYVIKMDADIQFDAGLFEQLAKRTQHMEEYGILSCTPYVEKNGQRTPIHSPLWHTNGDFKMYKTQCLGQIGGLIPQLGWDCADNIMAMEQGWRTWVFRDLFYRQNRPIGRNSLKKGIVRQGVGAYKLRYSLLYVLAKIVHDAFKPPYLISGVYYLHGCLKSFFHRYTRTITKKQGKMLRALLWQSMWARLKNKEFQIFQSQFISKRYQKPCRHL